MKLKLFPAVSQIKHEYIINVLNLVGSFGFNGPFETVFQSISGRLPKRKK